MDRKKKRNLVVLGLVLAAAIVIVIGASEVVPGLGGNKIDTTEGLELIKKAESANPADIEVKIRQLEAQNANGEETPRSLKEQFASVVVLGDSIAEGFAEYDVLNVSSVISDIELDWEGQLEQLSAVNPRIVFLSYCATDILTSEGDVEDYAKQYRKRIEAIREILPNATIFVNSILPVDSTAEAEEAEYKKLDEYNSALSELCDKLQVAYVDNSALPAAEYYENDGIHLKSGFYSIWAEKMTEVASL